MHMCGMSRKSRSSDCTERRAALQPAFARSVYIKTELQVISIRHPNERTAATEAQRR